MSRSVTIVGGGIIGLSVAYELLHRDWRVTIVERGALGKSASWAGAGILLPANRLTMHHPLEQLSALSNGLHAQWAERLLNDTGRDNGYHRCGGLYVGRQPGEVAAMSGLEFQWSDEQIAFKSFSEDQLGELPGVYDCEGAFAGVRKALYLPDESQVYNPRHLEALIAACEKMGATILTHQENVELDLREGKLAGIVANGNSISSDRYLFCCGAWTEEILKPIQKLPMLPVRGQMVMYKLPEPIFAPIVYEGSYYLVPRRDGYVLAGATVEEVGFDRTNTDEAIQALMDFAARQFPRLNEQSKVKHWAGLRPTTFDGFPYIGRLNDVANAFVATGHFRLGIQLSTGTAEVVSDLLEGKEPSIDLRPFSVQRVF